MVSSWKWEHNFIGGSATQRDRPANLAGRPGLGTVLAFSAACGVRCWLTPRPLQLSGLVDVLCLVQAVSWSKQNLALVENVCLFPDSSPMSYDSFSCFLLKAFLCGSPQWSFFWGLSHASLWILQSKNHQEWLFGVAPALSFSIPKFFTRFKFWECMRS